MDEMAFALDFEMSGHKQSELGRSRNTTSKKRERTGLKAQGRNPRSVPDIIQYRSTNIIKHL